MLRAIPGLLALCFASAAMVVLLMFLGIAGQVIAPIPNLATLPLAISLIALPIGTIGVRVIMTRCGRRTSLFCGAALGALGCSALTVAYSKHHFIGVCAAAAIVGFANAFTSFYRFATAELFSPEYQARSHSASIAAGLVASLMGPPLVLVVQTESGFDMAHAAFVSAAAFFVLAGLVVTFHRGPTDRGQVNGAAPPKTERVSSFTYAAVAAGAMSIAMMTLYMVAAPLVSMTHHMSAMDLSFIMQLHFVGMYTPGILAGILVGKLGIPRILVAGLILGGLCVVAGMLPVDSGSLMIVLFLAGSAWSLMIIAAATSVSMARNSKLEGSFNLWGALASSVPALGAAAVVSQLGWNGVNALAGLFVGISALWLLKAKPRDGGHVTTRRRL